MIHCVSADTSKGFGWAHTGQRRHHTGQRAEIRVPAKGYLYSYKMNELYILILVVDVYDNW
jgi:hypothetical protein